MWIKKILKLYPAEAIQHCSNKDEAAIFNYGLRFCEGGKLPPVVMRRVVEWIRNHEYPAYRKAFAPLAMAIEKNDPKILEEELSI